MQIDVLLIVTLGIFLGFFIQTVVGFAGALIALPILLICITLPDAIAYISIFYFFSSTYLVAKEWNNMNKKLILKLGFASVIGVAAGIWVLNHGKPLFLKKTLGGFILIYVIYSFYFDGKLKNSSLLEYVFGFFGGFFSGVFSTGGPLYVIIVKNSNIDMKTFRATMFGVLGLVSIVRIPMICISGILKWSHLSNSLLIFPFFFLAIFLGKKMYSIVNEVLLKKSVLILLFISGIILALKS
jgi:uncharacterized membrane protein YfcA